MTPVGTVSLNQYHDIGAEQEKMKEIADEILRCPYARRLVPAGIYKGHYVQGGDCTEFVSPTEGEELKLYKSKAPEIVRAVQRKVEKKLNRPVAIEDLMKTLGENHDQFFNFII